MKKRTYSVLAITLSIMMLFSLLPVSATEIQAEVDWESKVSEELLEVMETKTDTDLISIYIWLNDIDHDIIDEAMIKEKGMDPAVYENEERFNKEIVPQIEAQIVSRVGYEAAHAAVETSEYVLDQNGAYHDDTMSLVDRAIQAKENEYIKAFREVTKEVLLEHNNAFINKYVNRESRVLDVGTYSTNIIVDATISEIKEYAILDIVHDISLYKEYIPTTNLSLPLEQVSAGYNGTKGTSFNNGAGFKGTGIKIGVLELGKYDANNPHLSGISSSRLHYTNIDGTGINADNNIHATVVTSIIVGQSVTVNGTAYEGVVPLATVYQMSIYSWDSVKTAIETLAAEGVSVINASFGYLSTGTSYNDMDRELDDIINRTGIAWVSAAGNTSGYVMSPGKAMNAITVGNVETVSTSFNALTSPYSMRSTSSYDEDSILPNKPDISAPGTRIRIVKSTTGTDNFYYNNGLNSSGTSFAAPIVTGIVAQMQQSGALGFCRWPALVKSVLVTGADPQQIKNSTSASPDSTNPTDGRFLWEKSGAGMVNAVRSVTVSDSNARWNLSYFFEEGQTAITSQKYFTAGQHLRVTVVHNKINTYSVTSISSMDNLNLHLLDADGNAVVSNTSYYDNVIVIDHIITESGYYSFKITAVDLVLDEDMYYYYSWYAY